MSDNRLRSVALTLFVAGLTCVSPAPLGAQTTVPDASESLAFLPVSRDIGAVGAPGSSSFDGTTYRVTGSGSDIWGAADAFHYMAQAVRGDFAFTARVASVEDVHRWTKAGVMIREAATDSSRHAFIFATPTTEKGVAFQVRGVSGGPTVHTAGRPVATPVWLRLTRAGDVVTAFSRQSSDDPWTLLGTHTLSGLSEYVHIGLAVTSHADGTPATAMFDTVSATAATSEVWTSTDVGVVGAAGSASLVGSIHTLRGAGADIWGAADAFRYQYKTRTGDFQIVARVTSVQNVDPWTKAGVMVREGLDRGARHASLFVTPTPVKGMAFQRRPVAHAWSTHTAGPTLNASVWILLTRTGDMISAYASASGIPDGWVLIDRQSFIALDDTLQVGLAVSSHRPGVLAKATFESVRVSDSASLTAADIGGVGVSGTENARAWPLVSMEGSGADIWGAADAFRFNYARWTGDGTMTVRVRSIENTHPWAKAGLMFRDTLDANAKQVMTIVAAERGVAMQYRAATGGVSANAALATGAAPEWLRLTRRGDSFTGYASEDGAAWRTLGTVTVSMGLDVSAGLALTSHDNTTLASATFDNWQLVREAPVQTPSFTIVAPAPGSTLRATTATFQWDAQGDEFWLNIGTAPGGSDLYASGPLGQATQHTVHGLPLNGATLYVQLRRRAGSLVESVNVPYIAPVRRGVLVITDFTDRRLEDWTGPGMRSVADISIQLRKMEDHWRWLSRGLERYRWDIIRIRLPHPAVTTAYPGWSQFRDAAITLAKQQVRTADYDVNSDGVLDQSFLIVSNGDIPLDYAIGGSSRNAGSYLFVDGQSSLSVQREATGNFSHEIGHPLGLPDLYGSFDTLHALTLMSDSWALPPQDFGAYERVKLGWVVPQVVRATTAGVWLKSANDTLSAVKVPTSRPSEYFLIEYRRRPSSGYGSAAPAYNGLAIYHVLEGSSNSQNPPMVALEPADGMIRPNEPMDLRDFVHPDNPALLRPLVLRSYYGDQEVVRLDNVVWRNGGIAFDLTIAAAPPTSNLLLQNPSFESGQANRPDAWTPGGYVPGAAAFPWPSPVASSGERSAQLVATSPNDIWWSQTVATLVPGQTYTFCGWLKGDGISGTEGGVGGNVSVLGGFVRSESLWGTFDWTHSCVTFTAETTRVDLACRMGFYGSTVSGTLWCDELSLEPLRKPF